MDYSKKLKEIDEVIKNGFYKDDWGSLTQFEIPEWFKKAKFGIFVHWGLYSVPAFNNEWYSKNMYVKDSVEYKHHIETYGEHKNFGYKDFIPMFTAEKFEPKEWIKAFKNSGAKYLFQVAEHHDGFQMYKSEVSKFNTFDMTPNRDILGELKIACEEEGLKFCASNHRAEHWFFMSGGREFESDISDDLKRGDFYWPSEKEGHHLDFNSEPTPSEEFLEDWLIRNCEIVDNYMPELMYFDWWVQHNSFKPYLRKFMAYYYNKGLEKNKKVAICYKHDGVMFNTGIVEVERGKLDRPQPYYWQTDTAIARNSWCYTTSLDYKSSKEIITNLIDIVSKNANLLLNVGPMGNGEIPKKDMEILNDIGEWLKINGEGIYDSQPWSKHKEGDTTEDSGLFSEDIIDFTKEDIRFTVANGYLYAYVLEYKLGDEILIKSLKDSTEHGESSFYSGIKSVKVLGYEKEIQWEKTTDGLKIEAFDFDTNMPVCVRVEML